MRGSDAAPRLHQELWALLHRESAEIRERVGREGRRPIREEAHRIRDCAGVVEPRLPEALSVLIGQEGERIDVGIRRAKPFEFRPGRRCLE